MKALDLEADLRQMSSRALLRHFQTLPAPAMSEMDGEFSACLLAQPNRLAATLWPALLNNPIGPGLWQAKAFRPIDSDHGRGYNRFDFGGRSVRRFPMQTLVAPSRYDGKPAFTLVYGGFRSLCGRIHMVDEVRRAAKGLYLGLGTCGFSDAQRRVAIPFLLRGPIAPYVGDIGKPRRGFDPCSELVTPNA